MLDIVFALLAAGMNSAGSDGGQAQGLAPASPQVQEAPQTGQETVQINPDTVTTGQGVALHIGSPFSPKLQAIEMGLYRTVFAP